MSRRRGRKAGKEEENERTPTAIHNRTGKKEGD